MSGILLVTFIIIVSAILIGAMCACFVYSIVIWADYDIEAKRSLPQTIRVQAKLVVAALALTFVMVWWFSSLSTDDPGYHSWRGGAGPATVCQYEDHTETVGKVSQQVTYTVCRDGFGEN